MQKGGQVDTESCSALISWAPFDYTDWSFSAIFLSCKVNARVWLQSRGTTRIPPPGHGRYTKVPVGRCTSIAAEFATLSSNPREPSNQSIPPHIGSLRAPRAGGFSMRSPGPKPRLYIIGISKIPSYSVRCPLLSPHARLPSGIHSSALYEHSRCSLAAFGAR
jgi:hypothetical protein